MYNVIAHNVTYRWYWFTRNIWSIQWSDNFFALSDFVFIPVDTNSNIQPKQLQHWYIWDYTRNVARYIDMSFGVFAKSEQERFDAIKLVNSIFEPPSVFSPNDKWYYDLTFSEPDWNTVWTMKAKVIDRPVPSNYDNSCWMEFKVRLIVWNSWCRQDTCMYSQELFTCSDHNRVMGIPLWEELWFPLWYQWVLCKPNYLWASQAPVNVMITCTIPHISNNYMLVRCFRSDWSQTLLRIEDLSLVIWDVIYIDSINNTITLNWFDITGRIKQPYWVFPRLWNWSINPLWSGNNFLVVDIWVVDPWINDNVLDVTWEWRNTWC